MLLTTFLLTTIRSRTKMPDFSYSYDSEDTFDDEGKQWSFPYHKPEEIKSKSRDFSGEDYDDTDYDYWASHE